MRISRVEELRMVKFGPYDDRWEKAPRQSGAPLSTRDIQKLVAAVEKKATSKRDLRGRV